jgi:1-acyl-sn-glycerol-3-phosphate acyltransferase
MPRVLARSAALGADGDSCSVRLVVAGAGKVQDRVRTIIGPVTRFLWHIDVQGADRLPDHGGAILCPNHISFLDSAFLIFTMPRRISFVGKAEYLDSWKTRYLFPAMGMIPIDRSGGEASTAALDAAEEVLRRGELFGIFPEGTRSRDGCLYKGHTGPARLAIETGCPIYPVGITGTAEIQPPDAKLPKLFKSCAITVGEPIDPGHYGEHSADHLAYRRLTDEVMFEIRALTGQVYRDVYATRTADALPTAPARVRHVSESDNGRADERAHALAS